MTAIRTSLERHMAATPIPEDQLRRMAAAAWHRFGVICLRPEMLRNDFDRQAVVNAAEKLFGKREERRT